MPNAVDFQYRAIDKVSAVLDKLEQRTKKLRAQVTAFGLDMNKAMGKAGLAAEVANAKMGKLAATSGALASKTAAVSTAQKSAAVSMASFNSKMAAGQLASNGFVTGLERATKRAAMFAAVVGGIGVYSGARFQDSMASLSAITGLAGDELQKYGVDILAVSDKYAIASSTISKGIEVIGSKQPQLLKTPDIMLKVADAASVMAKASGMELSESAMALSDAMNQFNIQGEDAAKVVDVLAAGAKYGAAQIPELTSAIIQAGPAASLAKVSLQETTAAVEILAQKGIEGSRAGRQLRNMFIRLEAQANKNLKPSIVGIDQALANLSSKADDAKYLTKMFGVENINAASIMIKNRQAIASMSRKVDEQGVAMDQARIRMATATQAAYRLWTVIKNQLIRAFLAVEPAITASLAKAAKFIEWITGASNGAILLRTMLMPVLMSMVFAFGLIAASLIAIKISAFFTAMLTGIPILISAAGAAWSFATAIVTALAPVYLIIAAIALIGLAVYMVIKHWSKVKAFFVWLWNWIKTIFMAGFNFLKDLVVGYFRFWFGLYRKIAGWFGFGKNSSVTVRTEKAVDVTHNAAGLDDGLRGRPSPASERGDIPVARSESRLNADIRIRAPEGVIESARSTIAGAGNVGFTFAGIA